MWALSRFLEKRRGEYNFVVKGRKLHLSQDDKRVVAVVVLAVVKRKALLEGCKREPKGKIQI